MKKKEWSQSLSEDYAINLSDFALFLSVMKNKEAYECTLSIILEEQNLELTEVKVEQVVLNRSGKRAIRMDERIVKLDRIINEVKQSEEWEAVKMNILEIGEERGRENKLVELICRKLQKGKNVELIAEELEEDIDYVGEICKAAENAASDYDPRVVYRAWKKV